MSKKLQLKLDFDVDLKSYVSSYHPEILDFRILSKSLDARGAPRGKKPVYLYSLETLDSGESYTSSREEFRTIEGLVDMPIIIGAGPAGLFAALRFAEYGIATTIIERGEEANKRMLQISKYWRKGEMNTESNVCFGEGGAGLFSDGKLITRVKSPYIKYVMQKFVDFGAPKETAYISNPHVGSNKIRKVITGITSNLKTRGHEIKYNTRVNEILFKGDRAIGVKLSTGEELFSKYIILGTGHSAHQMYRHLIESDVAVKQKDFAVGVRIEHPRLSIDQMQHGEYSLSPILGAARYRLSYHNRSTDKGSYSFCMCPGGYVLSSGTESDGIVVNGMSNSGRNSPWSNSALVVSVNAGKDFSKDELLAGLDFQADIEQKAYRASKKEADGRMLPAMTVKEFLCGRVNERALPKTSSPSGIFKTDLAKILPKFIVEHLKIALKEFEKNMKGFTGPDAVLIAPETRTSAPLTICRDKKTFESTSHKGLYPCGEGAGHAGGITSAAVDGVKVAESIISSL